MYRIVHLMCMTTLYDNFEIVDRILEIEPTCSIGSLPPALKIHSSRYFLDQYWG